MATNGNSDLTVKKKRKKRVMPIMMLMVVVIGMLVGVGSFCMAYSYMSASDEDENTEERFSANGVLEQAQSNLIGSDIDAVVKSIDVTKGNINFYNLKNDTTTTVTATETTIFPKNVTMDTITTGDVFTYVFDKDRKLKELKKCEKAWTVEDIGVAINTSAKLVKFTGTASKANADTSYKYVEGMTTVKYKNEIKTLANISPLDYIRITGYDNGKVNRAYSLEILKSHGEIQLQNVNAITNAKMYINDKQYSVKNNSKVLLTEGTYTVKITGSNTEDITKQINVVPNTPTVLDLSKIAVKSGVLTINSNVTGYKLFINDKEEKAGESPLLEYGTYTIKATKEGYKDFTATVEVKGDTNSVNINLQKISTGGTINLTSVPASAQIYIDGNLAGNGNVSQNVALGSYVVECKADGYNPDKKQVNVSADGQVINITFQLTAAQ